MGLRRLVLSRRTLIALAVTWAVLFGIAGAAFNGSTNADNVVWTVVFVALLLLVVLGVVALVALVRSRRSRAG